MPRIRSLKPEFWDDRKLARSNTRDGRMLYMGLWNQADEHSRLNGDPVWIKGRVFPFDDDIDAASVALLLEDLVAGGWVVPYEIDGDPYLFLPKLGKHQRLEPTKVDSRIPAPPTHVDTDESAPRADQPAPDTDESALLYVTGSMEHGSGSREHVGRAQTRARRIPDDWTPHPELVAQMRAEGIPDDLARRELPKFRDYWRAKSGKDAAKLDWPATWRNWLRREAERQPSRASPNGSTADQRARAALALADQLDRKALT